VSVHSFELLASVDPQKVLDLSDVGPVRRLARKEKPDLQHCESPANVDALMDLKSVSEAFLGGCAALRNVNGLANMADLRILDLSTGGSLLDVDGLARLSRLTEACMTGYYSLLNVDGLRSANALVSLAVAYCHRIKDIAPRVGLPSLSDLDLYYPASRSATLPLFSTCRLQLDLTSIAAKPATTHILSRSCLCGPG
jgi:hypothetical protein